MPSTVHLVHISKTVVAEVNTCDLNEFTCKNSQCIPLSYYCDSIEDCDDGSDELNCPVCHPPNQIFCAPLSQCLSSSVRCDGTKDCPDGSDERDCGKQPCDVGEFACSNFECIPKVIFKANVHHCFIITSKDFENTELLII